MFSTSRPDICYASLLSQAAAHEVSMDGQARGEATDPIVLHDEDGQAFAFRPLRVLRDEADLPAHVGRSSEAGSAR
jgi:hypothetical protein